jgi:hypothetical protein
MGIPSVEFRQRHRFHILQRCLVWVHSASGGEGWHCIAFSISAGGIGLTLPCALQPGTVLQIQAWDLPKAPSLKAKIAHIKPVQFVWFCGCELVNPLHETELQAWMSGPDDWLSETQPRDEQGSESPSPTSLAPFHPGSQSE